jgi:hypothetical protein
MEEPKTEKLRIAKQLEDKANAMEVWLKKQSSFFLQYDDHGHTMTYIRALRDVATFLRTEKFPFYPEGL